MVFLGQSPAQNIGPPGWQSGKGLADLQNVFLIDHQPVGASQTGFQRRMRIRHRLQSLIPPCETIFLPSLAAPGRMTLTMAISPSISRTLHIRQRLVMAGFRYDALRGRRRSQSFPRPAGPATVRELRIAQSKRPSVCPPHQTVQINFDSACPALLSHRAWPPDRLVRECPFSPNRWLPPRPCRNASSHNPCLQ